MKNIFYLLLLIVLFWGCSTTKNTTQAQVVETKVEETTTHFNLFVEMCSCKNAEGYTIDSYGQTMLKEKNQSLEEYLPKIPSMMNDRESWIFKEFINDETYLTNMGSLSSPDISEEEMAANMNKNAEEARKKFPICMESMPYLMMLGQ